MSLSGDCFLTRVLDAVERHPVLRHLLFKSTPLAATLFNQRRYPRLLWVILVTPEAVLRGISQVTFGDNFVTGALILLGSLISNVQVACLGVFSSIVGTMFAGLTLPDVDMDSLVHGLHSYNGFLLGCGMAYFNYGIQNCGDAACQWHQFGALMIPTIILSIFCEMVFLIWSRLLTMPTVAFPFNITLSMFLAIAATLDPASVFSPTFVHPSDNSPIEWSDVSAPWLVQCILAGIGQIYFSPNLVSSCIMLGGIFVGSPINSGLGLFGSTVTVLVATILHCTKSLTEIGVDFTGAMASIGIGGFFFVPSVGSVSMAFIAACMAVGIRHVFTGLFIHPGPAMAFPFCLSTGILYLYGYVVKKQTLVPNNILSNAERHLAVWTDARSAQEELKCATSAIETKSSLDRMAKWPLRTEAFQDSTADSMS